MKKIVLCLSLLIVLSLSSSVYAIEADNNSDIPSMTIEEFILMNKSKQTKVEIIKKNNIEIETYKNRLKEQINIAVEKIKLLRIDIAKDDSEISDSMLNELKELLQFLQDSKTTLETDVERTSSEIEKILDLIMVKGIQLEQYDKIIEKQNEVIVRMKSILSKVEQI